MTRYDKPRRLARVTVTLPAELAKRADAEAHRLDRSRSWVVAEALRRFLAAHAEPESVSRVAEPIAAPYGPAFEAARRSQREADLRLSPAERLRAAEELTEAAFSVRPQARFRQVLHFDSLDDYFAWKKRDLLW